MSEQKEQEADAVLATEADGGTSQADDTEATSPSAEESAAKGEEGTVADPPEEPVPEEPVPEEPAAEEPAPEEPAAEKPPAEEPPADEVWVDEVQPEPEETKPPPGEVLITAKGLSKYYGRFRAIEDVSFQVRRGQVIAFLGPNGAGKSTTMKILTGLIAPDRGHAEIAGLSVIDDRIEVASKLGYLPENGPLYKDMTPEGLLRFLGEARGMTAERITVRIADLKSSLHLETVMGKPISKLSKGYRQRVGLAQALLHEPDVLIMDEPTAGLDPNQVRDVRHVIREFGRNKAVLLSTHILQEVEAIADEVVFIHQGKIVYQGPVDGLKAQGDDLADAFAKNTGYTESSGARS
jgi:ABC-2 type transport system ATP-binding protein